MLNAIRKSSKTWTGKIIMIVAGVALVVSLGFGDVFRSGGGSGSVAMVGELEISEADFAREFRREMRRVESNIPNITVEMAANLGLAELALNRLITKALVANEADTLSLTVTDQLVKQRILSQTSFVGENGEFDRNLYNQALFQANLTPEIYEEMVRSDVQNEQVVDTILSGQVTPTTLSSILYRHRNEVRSAKIAFIPSNLIAIVNQPTELQMNTFYAENKSLFTVPEDRAITYLHLTPESVMDDSRISESELIAEYEARGAMYDLDEQRDIQQILSPDKILIDEAMDLLASGSSFEIAVRKMAKRGATVMDMGGVERSSLPKIAGDAVFDLDVGQVSKIVKTSYGWHLFKLNKIIAPRRQPFSEVRESLYKEISTDTAIDDLYRLSTVLEDELAGGSSLEEAGALLGVKVRSLPNLDKNGLSSNGASAFSKHMVDASEIVREAFSMEVGDYSPLIETESGNYLVVRVDSISPPALLPLLEVEQKVKSGWKKTAQKAQAKLIAEKLSAEVIGPDQFNSVFKKNNYGVNLVEGLLRNGNNAKEGITREIVLRLFDQKISDPEPIIGEASDGYIVALLTEVVPVSEIDNNNPSLKSIISNLTNERRNDVYSVYRYALSSRYKISTNQTALKRILDTP